MDERTGNRRPATGNRQSSMRLGRDIAGSAIHKVAKEVRESVYWLEFTKRSAWTKQDLPPAILSASARTARAHR